jgi:hypothetical protein
MKKAGIVIIIIGFLLTFFTAFTLFTREKIVDIGDLKITAKKPHSVSWSPLIGVGVMIAGGIIFVSSPKKS